MEKKDFLFELGVEEIPVTYIAETVKTIRLIFETNLKKANLEYNNLEVFSTPRRFIIKIFSLQTQQKDEIVERIGPTKEMAYDANGDLTKAAIGFLRGAGAEEKDIILMQTPKGEKIAIEKEIKGLSTITILQKLIKRLIPEIKFPKSMKWGSSKITFARPIRWLLVLFGDEVIEVKYDELKSGNTTLGNRFQKLDNPVEIKTIEEYEEKLSEVFVIPNRDLRKQKIINQIKKLFSNSDEKIIENEKLLEIVTDLVEYPTSIIAEFDIKYLKLPEKVVTSTLSEHQKYFSVSKLSGELSNKFVFVSNGDPHYSDLIRQGNEKVITARLEDAEFFYKEDTAQPFEQFVQGLSEVTFQQQLGSVLEKTNRIKEVTKYICEELLFDSEIQKKALRAAHLCKADLVTQMLGEKEFTKLQGYIGNQYAIKSGEEKIVARAIEEHYLNGDNEMSIIGSVVAIADKVDTICGIIGVNLIPTGSKDPFALRRAANGIVQIIANQKFELDIHKLIDKSYDLLTTKLEKAEHNKDLVYDFFEQRTNWLLKQKQIDYDVIDSVMHFDHFNIPDLINRAESLQTLKGEENFVKLVLGFKSVSNIIAERTDTSQVNSDLLKDEMERTLYDDYLNLSTEIKELLPDKNYSKILELLIDYGSTIDKFFDEVLVNVEDDQVKKNRFSLLICVRELFLKVADISKIVIE